MSYPDDHSIFSNRPQVTLLLIRALLRKLRFLLERRDLVQFGWLLVAIMVMALSELIGIASVLPFMKIVAEPNLISENAWLSWLHAIGGFESDRSLLIFLGVTVLALFSLSRMIAAFTTWYTHRCGWSMAHSICMRLLRTYSQLPYEFFLTHNTAGLMKKVAADVHNLISGVLMAGMEMISHGMVTVVIMALLVVVEPGMALTAIVLFAGTYTVIHWLRHKYATRLGRERLEADGRRYKTFLEALTGMKAMQSDGAETFFIERFREASQRVTNVHPRFQLVTIIPRYLIEILAFGGILAYMLFLLATDQNFIAAVPTLGLFSMAAYRLLPALNKVFTAAAQINHNLPVVDEIYSDVSRVPLCRGRTEIAPLGRLPFRDRIALDKACFRYDTGAAPVLRDIDIAIRKGSNFALVGPTGSGKTTLVDVLLGLLLPQSGTLSVDGMPISAENVARWRAAVGYVPQEVFLFDDTLAQNIAFGVPTDEIDTARVRRASRLAEIDDFISQDLPQGYETEVGERGVRLSGGQRQRIGLARALYRCPDVLLLDEATSALDGITEEAVISGIERELPDITLVMIAYRLSTVRLCETIYLLNNGRVTQAGSYDELISSSHLFREMVESSTRR